MKIIDILKEHYILGVLILLCLLFIPQVWFNMQEHSLGDLVIFYLPRVELLHQSITMYDNSFPLWNPYVFGGTPEYLTSNFLNIFYLPGPLLYFMSSLAALKVTIILDFILAAIAMYCLAYYLTRSPFSAFVAGFIYVFAGYSTYVMIFAEWVDFANAYPLIPLFFLFLFKAFKTEASMPIPLSWELITNSMICGVILALVLIGSSGTAFLYLSVMMVIWFAINTVDFDKDKFILKVIKHFCIGIMILSLAFGLAAFKLLPNYEWQTNYGVRGLHGEKAFNEWVKISGDPRPYEVFEEEQWEDASGRTIAFNEWSAFVKDPYHKLGVVSIILALIGLLFTFKKRITIFLALLVIFALLMISGSFLLRLMWDYYPSWYGMRYADRATIVLIFSTALLAAIGTFKIGEYINKKNWSVLRIVVIWTIFALLFVDLHTFGIEEKKEIRNIQDVIDANPSTHLVMNLVNGSNNRVHVVETTGIDWGTEFYTVPLGLEQIYGYHSNWDYHYLNGFLVPIMFSEKKSQYWGMMNVKYVISTNPINVPGLKLVARPEECKVCFPEQPNLKKAYGTYIYENINVAPRAYIVTENNEAVLIPDSSIHRNSFEEVTIDIPDFLPEDIFYSLIPGKLVVSEKFAYHGWKAYVDGEEIPIYKENEFTTVVNVKPKEKITFKFEPQSLKRGKFVSIVTLLILFCVGTFLGIKRWKNES